MYENLTGSPKASAKSVAADKAVSALVKLISLWLSLYETDMENTATQLVVKIVNSYALGDSIIIL